MRLILVALMLCIPPTAKAQYAIKNVIQTDNIPPHKISFDVILKRRITKDELEKIARAIKAQHPNYDRIFIGYFIVGTAQAKTRINGHWGSSHWEGDKLHLMPGPSETDIAKRRAAMGPPVPDGAEVVGRWFVPGSYGGHVAIYKKDGKAYAHQLYLDGSGTPSEVVAQKHKSGTAYKESGSYDYFVVNKAGNLEMWDKSGRLEHDESVKVTE